MDWGKLLLTVAIGALAYGLILVAPAVPKAIVFFDDVHAIRQQSEKWHTTAEGIRIALEKLGGKKWFSEEDTD